MQEISKRKSQEFPYDIASRKAFESARAPAAFSEDWWGCSRLASFYSEGSLSYTHDDAGGWIATSNDSIPVTSGIRTVDVAFGIGMKIMTTGENCIRSLMLLMLFIILVMEEWILMEFSPCRWEIIGVAKIMYIRIICA